MGVSRHSGRNQRRGGLTKRPNDLFPQKNAGETTAQIAQWWTERWLLPRIARDDVLERVASHRLTHPIRHGERKA